MYEKSAIFHKQDEKCCKALTAECLACTAGQSVEEFCRDEAHKVIVGCKSNY